MNKISNLDMRQFPTFKVVFNYNYVTMYELNVHLYLLNNLIQNSHTKLPFASPKMIQLHENCKMTELTGRVN